MRILRIIIVVCCAFVLIFMGELCGYFVPTCVWCSCVFSISSVWGVFRPGGFACHFHLRVFLTLSLVL